MKSLNNTKLRKNKGKKIKQEEEPSRLPEKQEKKLEKKFQKIQLMMKNQKKKKRHHLKKKRKKPHQLFSLKVLLNSICLLSKKLLQVNHVGTQD